MNPAPVRGILTTMNTVEAIYEDGVFRPLERVELPEHCRVRFEPTVVASPTEDEMLDKIYEVMSREFNSGEHDVAARHNEHQP